jgi:hypothetical protein
VLRFVNSTRAPATTAPVESVTRPDTTGFCAIAAAAAVKNKRERFLIALPIA